MQQNNVIWLFVAFCVLILFILLFLHNLKFIVFSLAMIFLVYSLKQLSNQLFLKIYQSIYWVDLIDKNNYKLLNINNEAFYLNLNNVNIKLNLWDKVLINGEISNKYFNYIKDLKVLNSYDIRYHIFSFANSINQIYSQFLIPLLFGSSVNYQTSPFVYASELGLIHILIISGMHFQLLFAFLKVCFKGKLKNISYILCIIYWLMCLKTISVNRAFFTIMLNYFVNKKLDKEYKFLFILVLTVLFTSNLQANSQGYWLSFILSIFISNMEKENYKKSIGTYLVTYFHIWLISTSLIIIWKDQINLSSWFLSIFISPIFEILYIILIIFIWLPPAISLIQLFLDNLLWLLMYLKLTIDINLILKVILPSITLISFLTVFINKKQNKL